MGEVRQRLEQLRDGEVTLEQVAREFSQRQWTTVKTRPAVSSLEDAADDPDFEDAAGIPEDSWPEVTRAYFKDELTDEQYAVLSEAFKVARRSAANAGGAAPEQAPAEQEAAPPG